VSWYSSTSTWLKRAPISAEFGFADHLRPVEQQVVVVEHLLRLLGLDVLAEQAPQFGFPLAAPGKAGLQHRAQVACVLSTAE
jgi:hypothetical protein